MPNYTREVVTAFDLHVVKASQFAPEMALEGGDDPDVLVIMPHSVGPDVRSIGVLLTDEIRQSLVGKLTGVVQVAGLNGASLRGL